MPTPLNDYEALYFESHITVEPVFGERLELLHKLASTHEFRVANLVMLRDNQQFPNQKDSFISGRSEDFSDLYFRHFALLFNLEEHRYNVYRDKIEASLMDSKWEAKSNATPQR